MKLQGIEIEQYGIESLKDSLEIYEKGLRNYIEDVKSGNKYNLSLALSCGIICKALKDEIKKKNAKSLFSDICFYHLGFKL